MKSWTAVFLLDKTIPTKIVLLKRDSTKEFAPNRYTGIGGHVEPGEDALAAGYRELEEETGIKDQKIVEFAQAVFENGDTIHYYWAIYGDKKLPTCNEGTLEWVKSKELLGRDFIPTAATIISEWKKRDFSLDRPFTNFLTEADRDESNVRSVKVKETKEGLALYDSTQN